MKKLLYFTAQWCGPCKMIAPMINELSSQYNIHKIDIDQDPDMAHRHNVKSIPTFIAIDALSGNEIQRKIGVRSKGEIISMLQ